MRIDHHLLFCVLFLSSTYGITAQPGVLDPTFGSDGIQLFERPETRDRPGGIAVQADGRIIVAAIEEQYPIPENYEYVELVPTVWRLLENGEPDPSFGNDGYLALPLDLRIAHIGAVVIDAQGRIVIGGGCLGSGDDTGDMFAARFLPNGVFDPSFNGNGFVQIGNAGIAWETAHDLALATDGSMALVGQTRVVGSSPNTVVARLLENGTPDPSFGTNGVSVPAFYLGYDEGVAISIRDNGRLIVAGVAHAQTARMFVCQLLTTGELDGSFATGGLLWYSTPDDNIYLRSMVLDEVDRVVVAGRSTPTPQMQPQQFFVARVTEQGLFDPSFGTEGIVLASIPGSSGCSAEDLALGTDDSYFVVGPISNAAGFGTMRILANGEIDPTFGDPAPAVVTGVVPNEFTRARITVQQDGRVVVLCGVTAQVSPYFSDLLLMRFGAASATAIATAELKDPFSITIVPNPLDQHSVLRLTTPVTGTFTFRFTDLQGRTVLAPQKWINIAAGTTDIAITEALSLAPGLYHIQVINSDQQRLVRLVVP